MTCSQAGWKPSYPPSRFTLVPPLASGGDEVTRMVSSDKEDLGTGGGVDNLTLPLKGQLRLKGRWMWG